MKILKIELQNINSLRSDAPISIDFQSDHFRDVGLFAITGSTGAGKTTILDAITISLYHNVPRFNKTKGTLLDVVSFGANDAFTRITFENDHSVYEGYWGIRLANRNGTRLKNPSEEVSLKNLTTGKTLANQKRSYIKEIEEVTQLDYKQFLRSVMLAQGDFASFLSAKGPEKGKLLEQITGEEIYKQIGQGILDRKSSEEGKLAKLESKINSEDTINEEERVLLLQQQAQNKVDIAQLEKEKISVKRITDWYDQQEKLVSEASAIEKKEVSQKEFAESHADNLALLSLNEKAEPYKELLQSIQRTEKSVLEKEEQIKQLSVQLQELTPSIELLQSIEKTHTDNLIIVEEKNKEWEPKFDTILKIETELTHQKEQQAKAKLNTDTLNTNISELKEKQTHLSATLLSTSTELEKVKTYTSEHQHLSEVAKHFARWTTALTDLKNKKNTYREQLQFIQDKEVLRKEAADQKALKIKSLEKEEKSLASIEKELAPIAEQLQKVSFNDLIAKKELTQNKERNWTNLKELSTQFSELTAEKIILSDKTKELKAVRDEGTKKRTELHTAITTQEKLVADAQRILDLEKSVKNYETDRAKLVDGEPCGLCGSTDHPFVAHGKTINLTASEEELANRITKLSELTISKNKLDTSIEVSNNNIANVESQLKSIDEQLASIQASASAIPLECELTNIDQINIQLNLVKEALSTIEKQVQSTQEIQVQKEKLSGSIQTQKERANSLKTDLAKLTENLKLNDAERTKKKEVIVQLSSICDTLSSDLTAQLSEFNYTLPSPENTTAFVETLENSIASFNQQSKQLTTLANEQEKLNLAITNHNNSISEKTKELEEFSKQLLSLNQQITDGETKRNTLLPSSISVAAKREELHSKKTILTTSIEENNAKLQSQLKLKTEKDTLKEKSVSDKQKHAEELENSYATINEQLIESDFESREAIENALLQKEEKDRTTEIKEKIRENSIQLETLKLELQKEQVSLIEKKDFETTKEEIVAKETELNIQHKELVATSGAIIERFRKDQEIRDRNKEIYVQIDAQAEICGTWKQLFQLIGNSKDAFNVYVQRITLQNLLELANIHLYKLNKRYSLQMEGTYKKGEELNFNLIDRYQTNQSRLVETSSGGEKFIISLALALGLSDLASKNVKIDSLFIDEGFGTLDNHTLETVISTLETLQSTGKMIGIISHVENLKERIPTQIQITKRSNGVSVLGIT